MLHPNKRREAIKQIAYEDGFHDGYRQAMSEMPEQVRCEDCEYSYTEGFVKPHLICEKHPELETVSDDWYCADGWKA